MVRLYDRIMNKIKRLISHYRRAILLFLLAGLLLLFSPFIWRAGVQWHYGRFIHPISSVPEKPVAIVFGAAVYGNGRLSGVLRDRMDTAVTLYKQGRVEKLLVSGDNRFENYDEPSAMMAYAIQQGVDPDDIQPDFAGRRTYDTCYRAKEIFEIETAVLITQEFHLTRALFTCQNLGIASVGVAADLQPYLSGRWFILREIPATAVALVDIIRQQPAPVLGEKIPMNSN